MSIKIVEIDYPLNEKFNFTSKLIEYSDFRSYINDLDKFDKVLIFNQHEKKLEVFYSHPNGGINVHEAFSITNT